MKLFVADPIHDDAVAFLREKGDVELTLWSDPAIAKWRDEAEALIVRGSAVSAGDIMAAKKLKVIGRHGVGYEKIAVDAMKERGMALINAPFENGQSVAELAVGLLLACSRNIPQVMEKIKGGNWEDARKRLGGSDLYQAALGVVGFGRIARMTATMAKNAFGMTILAHDPFLPQDVWKDYADLATPRASLNELFASSDFISLHVPNTPRTLGMIGTEQFAAARKNLVIVNTARGGVVDEDALFTALKENRIRAAASDVFAKEPLNPDSPLLSLSNFIATPHYGGSTDSSLRRVACAVAREVHAFMRGRENPAYRVF